MRTVNIHLIVGYTRDMTIDHTFYLCYALIVLESRNFDRRKLEYSYAHMFCFYIERKIF